jgi:hypothetical protein
MTDNRAPYEPRRESKLGEAIDGAVRQVSAALVIAAAIVGLAVYARPGPPRFEAFAVGDRIVRVDTRKGTIIECQGQQTCQLILRSGQRLVRVKRSDDALPPPAAAKPLPPAPAAGK